MREANENGEDVTSPRRMKKISNGREEAQKPAAMTPISTRSRLTLDASHGMVRSRNESTAKERAKLKVAIGIVRASNAVTRPARTSTVTSRVPDEPGGAVPAALDFGPAAPPDDWVQAEGSTLPPGSPMKARHLRHASSQGKFGLGENSRLNATSSASDMGGAGVMPTELSAISVGGVAGDSAEPTGSQATEAASSASAEPSKGITAEPSSASTEPSKGAVAEPSKKIPAEPSARAQAEPSQGSPDAPTDAAAPADPAAAPTGVALAVDEAPPVTTPTKHAASEKSLAVAVPPAIDEEASVSAATMSLSRTQSVDDGVAEQCARFCGHWTNVRNDNLEAYLKHIGVSWAKRKIANSFKPQSSWAIVDGVLQVLTPTPLGDRLETFPLNVEQADEIDGQAWVKSHRWEGAKMITTARDPTKAKPDFVTERWIDDDDMLNQVNSHAGVAFTRYFKRDP